MGIKFNEQSGCWEAFYGKRHPTTREPVSLRRRKCKTKAEALRIEKELVVLVEERLRRTIFPTWEQLVQDYCKAARDSKDFTEKTVENYLMCLRAHTFAIWGQRLIDQITTDEIRELIRSKSDKSTSHQRNILKFIRGAFSYAVDKGLLQRNPTPRMKFKQGDKIRRVLAEPQARLLLEKSKLFESEWYPVWAMALYTGMRNGELFALTWDKVDFDRSQIKVDCSWNNKDGFKSTKSGDDRIVDGAPPLMALLKELKLESTDRVFVLPRITKWEDGYQAQALAHFLIGIHIEPVRFHDLRASWATMMLGKGVEPAKVMSMGGWKDIKTMMIYMRKAGIDIQGSAAVLNLHDPSKVGGKVLEFGSGSAL
jgi:integrase